MNTQTLVNYKIINTDYHCEDVIKADNGEYYPVDWLEITLLADDQEIILSMQHDCGSGYDLHESSGEITDEIRDFISDSNCFAELESQTEQTRKELELSDFEAEDHYEEVLALSKKVQAIAETERDCLLLAKALYEADDISINDTMIYLQINLDISQRQSSDIVDLFI